VPEVNCPHCSSETTELSQSGVTVDRCDNCGLIWFDPNEIHTFLQDQGPPASLPYPEDSSFRLAQTTAVNQCPRCSGNSLQRGALSGLPFFWCNKCNGIAIFQSDVADFRTATSGRFSARFEPENPLDPDSMLVFDLVLAVLTIFE
jgi:Zn-finger nucleic acid-binding protein